MIERFWIEHRISWYASKTAEMKTFNFSVSFLHSQTLMWCWG